MSSIHFPSAATTYVQLRGSDTVMALIQPIAYQYMTEFPKVALPVTGGGTSSGYKCVLDQTRDIGMASGGMNYDLRKWAEKKNLKTKNIEIAFDALAVFVHPTNQAKDLSLEELRDIVTGTVSDWKELGLPPGRIQVYSQNPNRGSYEAWRSVVLQDKLSVTLNAKVMDGKDIVTAIVNDPNGIGFSSPVNLINIPVKVISVNDFLPTASNIQTGKYPIRRSLSLVTAMKVKPAIQDFIDYCTDPKKGQSIIRNLGLVPTQAE
jgi:phosphate transport system substrate-binding protein